MQVRRLLAALLPAAVAAGGITVAGAPAAEASADSHDTWAHFNAGSAAIPDGLSSCPADPILVPGHVSVPVTVSGLPAKRVTEVDLALGIHHSWVGDLVVQLKAPNGASQTIFSRTGKDAEDPCGDASNLDGYYLFEDDAAGNTWWSTVGPTSPNAPVPTGTGVSYRATDATGAAVSMDAAFAGVTNPNGTWTVEVYDYGKGDTGGVTGVDLAVAVDTTAPVTAITQGPADGATVTAVPEFRFAAVLPPDPVHFECRLDGPILGGWSSCTSPYKPAGRLEPGTHTFQVRAVDASGNADTTPESRTFTYAPPDTTPPTTTIDSGPADGATVTTVPQFTFSSPSADVDHFQCRFDAAPISTWDACTSPFKPAGRLQAGQHTFSVRAVDVAGNPDPTPESRTFTYAPIDSTAPETAITGGPADGASVTSAPSYTFSSPSADAAGFECQIDFGSWSSCTSPFAVNVGVGGHTFAVRARDGAGNVDLTPASRRFTVLPVGGDTTPPETRITGGPANGASVGAAPTYAFDSPDSDATSFRCSVDGAAFTACISPKALVVEDGSHVFAVAAVDGAGNVDPTPATRTFTLITAPDTSEQCDQATLDLASAQLWKAKAGHRLDRAIRSGNPDRIRKARKNFRKARAAVREAKAAVQLYC
jgi:subtilisin-like proprotein convertase family protein